MATKMEKLYQELAEYFVFDKQKYTLEEFFSDIKTFKDLFKQVEGIFNKRVTLLIPFIVGVWFHIKRTRVWSQVGPCSGGEREGGEGKLEIVSSVGCFPHFMNNYSLLALIVTTPSCFPLSKNTFCFGAKLTNCCSLCNEVVRLPIYSFILFSGKSWKSCKEEGVGGLLTVKVRFIWKNAHFED